MNVTPIRQACPTRAALLELWRPIPGHPKYEASWDGRIRNARTRRVLKPQQAKGGKYAKVSLDRRPELGGRQAQVQVHQLLAETWLDAPDPGRPHVVDHRDNHGQRNVVTNLRWLTYSMNTRQWYAMNARFVEAGMAHGYDLEPVPAEDEWETTWSRLKAAGL